MNEIRKRMTGDERTALVDRLAGEVGPASDFIDSLKEAARGDMLPLVHNYVNSSRTQKRKHLSILVGGTG